MAESRELRSFWNMVIAVIGIIYLLHTYVTNRVVALLSDGTPNTTLVLRGCTSVECHIKGTLRTDPISLESYILKSDGTKLYFNRDEVSSLSWPVIVANSE
jgi:hypothetical protein